MHLDILSRAKERKKLDDDDSLGKKMQTQQYSISVHAATTTSSIGKYVQAKANLALRVDSHEAEDPTWWPVVLVQQTLQKSSKYTFITKKIKRFILVS